MFHYLVTCWNAGEWVTVDVVSRDPIALQTKKRGWRRVGKKKRAIARDQLSEMGIEIHDSFLCVPVSENAKEDWQTQVAQRRREEKKSNETDEF